MALRDLLNDFDRRRPITPGALPPARAPTPIVRPTRFWGPRESRGASSARMNNTTHTAMTPAITMSAISPITAPPNHRRSRCARFATWRGDQVAFGCAWTRQIAVRPATCSGSPANATRPEGNLGKGESTRMLRACSRMVRSGATYRATKPREPCRTDSTPKRLNKRYKPWRMTQRRYRTQEVGVCLDVRRLLSGSGSCTVNGRSVCRPGHRLDDPSGLQIDLQWSQ